MKFGIAVLILLSASVCEGWTQEQVKSKTDSLLHALTQAKDTARVEILHRLVRYHWRNEPNSVIHYAQEMLLLSQSLRYTLGMAHAYNAISYVYERRADFPKAMESRLHALELYEALKDKNGIAWCYHSLGNINDYQGKYDLAVDYHLKALKLREEIQDQKGVLWSLNRIGDCFANQGKHELALQYCSRALAQAEEIGLEDGICSAMTGVAKSYLRLSRYTEAKQYAQKALALSEKLGDKRYTDLALTALGESELHEHNYEKALEYFMRGLKIRQDMQIQNYVAESLERISRTLFLQKKHDAALQYALRSLETATAVQARNEEKNAYQLLYEISREKGDYRAALNYFEKFAALKDSLLSLEAQKRIAELELHLENERKDREIEALQKDREAKLMTQRLLVALAILSLMIIVLIALGYRQKARKNEELSKLNAELNEARQKAEIERQAAEQANMFKTELLGIAAHDLQNPLQSIMGFAMLIAEKVENQPETKIMAETITRSAKRMLGIITDLLKTTAIDSGSIVLEKSLIDLSALLHTVAENNQQLAQRKSQRLEVSLEPQLFAEVDSKRMYEVFENLLSNAIKYSPEGKTIWVSSIKVGGYATSEQQAPANRLRVTIRDEGQGLTEDDMQKLFGRFQRLSARPTGGESSTGLGLSIVKKIVELHGGKVWAESEGKDKGSAFFVELPAATPIEPLFPIEKKSMAAVKNA
jgi:signal transduction histidine kinase